MVKRQDFSGFNDPWLGSYGPIIIGVNLKESVLFPARRIALSASLSIILLAKRFGLKSLYNPLIWNFFLNIA